MPVEKLPDGFSFQFGQGGPVNESINELFLKTASNPTFPFLNVKIIPDENQDDCVVEIKVNKQVYELIKNTGQNDDLVFFLNNTNGSLAQWGSDMIIAMKILSKMNIFVEFGSWIDDARKSLSLLIKNEKVDAVFNQQNALKNSQELLEAIGILDQVNESQIISSSAKEVLREKSMDAGTLVYRLAMAIYHSNRNADHSILTIMDDPSSAYLKLANSPLFDKWNNELSEMMEVPLESRIKIMKVLIAFTVSSYVYNKLQEGKNE